MSPETTEGREGFIHPYAIDGTAAAARVDLILRDFEREGLAQKRRLVQAACDALQARGPATPERNPRSDALFRRELAVPARDRGRLERRRLGSSRLGGRWILAAAGWSAARPP